jgi:hypothetical protein
MKRLLLIIGLIALGLIIFCGVYVLAGCGDTWQSAGSDTYEGSCPFNDSAPYSQIKHWRIFWRDGYERNDAQAVGHGMCAGAIFTTYCLPTFEAPYWHQNTNGFGEWNQKAKPKIYASNLELV